MESLIHLITSEDEQCRNQSLETFLLDADTEELMAACRELDEFRKKSDNLYHRVRALFFLYAIHRFYLSLREEVSHTALIPYEAYEHMLNRRFEQAIDIFKDIQENQGPNEGISSGLAEAYHKLAFQTLADQVRFGLGLDPLAAFVELLRARVRSSSWYPSRC